jgi:nicotinamidase-related amidase
MRTLFPLLALSLLTAASLFSQENQMKQDKRTALLIIDIQNDYFEGGAMPLAGAKEAAENARLALEKARASSTPVIHIQHIATRADATFFKPGTRGAEIYDAVKPLPQEKVIVKHYPNSFRDTGLLDALKAQGTSDLVICGMMTHMCVDATTRAAKDYGFNCVVLGDACATKDLEVNGQKVKAEEVQKSFLAALNYFYSSVRTTGQYLNE